MRRSSLARTLIPILLAGCGVDSHSARMTPGMMATAHGIGDEPVPVLFSEKTELLAVGTTVKVLSDQEGDPTQARRRVVVSIQDGPSKGLAGQMYRSDLRPGD